MSRLEPDLLVGEIFCRHDGSHEAVKVHRHVFLKRLPEWGHGDVAFDLEPLSNFRGPAHK